MSKATYKLAGVDIKRADAFVRSLQRMMPGEGNRGPKAFASLYDLASFTKLSSRPLLVASADGVGTKLLIAQQLGRHDSVGIDLVAMNVNDIICLGARPLFFLDYIACGKLTTEVLLSVARGIKKGLVESDCQLLGGETAEMPGMYAPGEYDLAGFCVGAVERKYAVNGRAIKQGDVVIGLASSGLHSNGFSLVRKVLNRREIVRYAKQLLMPTRIYVKPILSLLSAFRQTPPAVSGIAHVTGGAYFHKVTKILPEGLGMVIKKRSWQVPEIFTLLQDKGSVSDTEMYSVFNMGIGMVIVTAKPYAFEVASYLQSRLPTYIIGEIVSSKTAMALV